MERLTAEVVEELPPVEEAESNKLYLLDSNHDGTYEVFLKATVSGEDQLIELGPIIDLTDYYNKAQVNNMIAELNAALAASHADVTSAQYDALPAEDKNNGTVYFVTDREPEGDFSNIETRLQKIEQHFDIYYEDAQGNRTILYTENTKQITRVDRNTVVWIIYSPELDKDFSVTVTMAGAGNTRYDPQITVEEVAQ